MSHYSSTSPPLLDMQLCNDPYLLCPNDCILHKDHTALDLKANIQ